MSEILWCADNGDGTYRNPVLYCDYSDPDAICVNGTYYLTASTFNYVPGLPILTSRDLVNWKSRTSPKRGMPRRSMRKASGLLPSASRTGGFISTTGCRTRASTWSARKIRWGIGTTRCW